MLPFTLIFNTIFNTIHTCGGLMVVFHAIFLFLKNKFIFVFNVFLTKLTVLQSGYDYLPQVNNI